MNCDIYSFPNSLIITIWLMFLWEVGGVSKIMRCAVCDKWMEMNDPRKKFCSNVCKTRSSREGKKGSKMSSSDNITKAELARQLGVSRAYITMLSNGKRKPSKNIVNKLETLGMTFNQGVAGSRPARPISNI